MPDTRRLEYRPLSTLKANPRNPKGHDLDTINTSVARFGLIDIIAVDDRTGYIVSGHGRTETLQAAKERGDNPPDGIRVEHDEWLVPVIVGWQSEDDLEAVAALITLNRTTELGGWVDESLLGLLDELRAVDAIEGVGFSDDDIAALRERVDVPDFEPDDSAIDRLDRRSVTDCPKCGYTFTPVTRSIVDDDG